MPKSPTRKKSPADIIAAARRPEQRVTICLRADIAGELEALDAELEQLQSNRPNERNLGGPTIPPEEVELAERIHALEVEADENSIDLVIRALPRNEWRAAKAKHPASEADSALGWAVDRDDVALAVLADSVVDPELDGDTLGDMVDALAEGQWVKIRDAILIANGGDGSVPFSQRASLVRRLSHSEEGSPEPTGSQSRDSTAGSPARGRRSPTGNTGSPQAG
jgi:hypothetical protein